MGKIQKPAQPATSAERTATISEPERKSERKPQIFRNGKAIEGNVT
jgi:hypothetical protein